jgi:riboflavin synthase
MFTGIVETHVPVVEISETPMVRRIWIEHPWKDLGHGESIALNGCCLTIAELAGQRVGFDVIKETLEKTNLGLLKVGERVNVERALQVGDRLDGHFVQGHVDGRAALVRKVENPSEVRLVIQPPADLRKYIVPKGSVSIDGVSLTVAAVNADGTFEVALIPTTLQLTILGSRPLGWPHNLETDIVSKHIVAWLEARDAAK